MAMREAEIEALESRLNNWREWWAFSGSVGRSQSTCASAERNYVAPRPDDEAMAASASVQRVDVADAERVNDALMTLAWEPCRAFLHCVYGKSQPLRLFLRERGIKHDDVAGIRARALEALAIALVRLERAQVVLIRRGARHWAGVESARGAAYNSATSASAERRDQPHGWSRAPGQQRTEEPA